METEYLKDFQEVDSTELYNLMTQYGDDVWRYAYTLTGNYEQSNDIAQEVFLKGESGGCGSPRNYYGFIPKIKRSSYSEFGT